VFQNLRKECDYASNYNGNTEIDPYTKTEDTLTLRERNGVFYYC